MSILMCALFSQDIESSRQVSLDDIVPYCRNIRVPFIETSAKVNHLYVYELKCGLVTIVNSGMFKAPLKPVLELADVTLCSSVKQKVRL